MIYLASPYAHPDPAVMQLRYEAVCRKAGELMSQGHVVFSPIAHNHPIAQFFNLPRTWEFWAQQDIPFLAHAHELWVLQLDGWLTSVGVTTEIAWANDHQLPVRYILP